MFEFHQKTVSPSALADVNRSRPVVYGKVAPKTTCLLFADLIRSFLIYSSELTYFSINVFQTTSLKRVQTATLTRFDRFCIPRVCAFHYSLDREYEEFVDQMKKLCKRSRTTFLDIRSARIHFPQSTMLNIPETHRMLNVFQCNIERLRDLKQIHQDLGHDLLVPSDQFFLSLDLLVANYQLVLCELDNHVRFRDAIILQSFVKDIFLQFRVILTWLHPAVKMAAFRQEDSNKQFSVQHCEAIEKPINQLCGTKNSQVEIVDEIPMKKSEEKSQAPVSSTVSLIEQSDHQSTKESSPTISESPLNDSLSMSNNQINHYRLPTNNNRIEMTHDILTVSHSQTSSPAARDEFIDFPSMPDARPEEESPSDIDSLSTASLSASMERTLHMHQLGLLDFVRLI